MPGATAGADELELRGAVHAPTVGLRQRHDLILNADRGFSQSVHVHRYVAQVERAALDPLHHAGDLGGECGLIRAARAVHGGHPTGRGVRAQCLRRGAAGLGRAVHGLAGSRPVCQPASDRRAAIAEALCGGGFGTEGHGDGQTRARIRERLQRRVRDVAERRLQAKYDGGDALGFEHLQVRDGAVDGAGARAVVTEVGLAVGDEQDVLVAVVARGIQALLDQRQRQANGRFAFGIVELAERRVGRRNGVVVVERGRRGIEDRAHARGFLAGEGTEAEAHLVL